MASDPDDVDGQAMALTPAEAKVLVAAVGEPATPNAERGAGPATYHPMHAPHGVRPGAPSKPVPALWRVGSTLLVLVACTLIGGAIAVEQGHLRLNAALIWVRQRAQARFAPSALLSCHAHLLLGSVQALGVLEPWANPGRGDHPPASPLEATTGAGHCEASAPGGLREHHDELLGAAHVRSGET